MNYTGKIDLMKLGKAALVVGKQGQDCILIDIKGSNLYLSKNCNVYLDVVCWESNNDYGSHTVKQQFPKDKSEQLKSLPKEERYKQDPILGSLKNMGTTTVPSATPVPNEAKPIDDSDLPF